MKEFVFSLLWLLAMEDVKAEINRLCVFVWFQPNLEGYEIHEVPLSKKDGQSLGISIIGYNPLTSKGRTGKHCGNLLNTHSTPNYHV